MMQLAKYSAEFIVRHHECGPDGLLKLPCLLDDLQDSAAEHAGMLGFGMEDLDSGGMIWVLSRLRLTIDRMPGLGEKLMVTTYPSGVEKLFATRQYAVAAGGQCLIRGSSAWLVLDRATYRPLPPARVLGSLPDNGSETRFHPLPGKLNQEPIGGERRFFEVGAAEIDLNDHLNNAIYARYILELFPPTTSFTAVQINFLHAGALGDRIGCAAEYGENGSFRCDGISEDGTIKYFQAEGTANTRDTSAQYHSEGTK